MEKFIARHCAPALAGIKCANIVSLDKSRFDDIHAGIASLNLSLNRRGIVFEVICECPRRVLLMVYRPSLLWKYLRRTDVGDFLRECGYAPSHGLCASLTKLKARLCENDFPHEIGAFLGYPMEDIYGFINHKDDGLLLVGEWKVYSDAEGAERMFHRYAACRRALVGHLERGRTLAEVFRAA